MKIKTLLAASVSLAVLATALPVYAQQATGTTGSKSVMTTNGTGRKASQLTNAMQRLENDVQGIEKDYNNYKSKLSNDFGISYSLDVSVMGQKGVPNGGKTATQSIYAPTVSWEMFNDKTFGSGTITASYTAVRYWGNNANNIADKMNFATSINDFSGYQNTFDQLSYTQTMFDNKLALTIGQFPMYNFDGTMYNSNQQINFVNYALTQNASETYSIAGMGAYLQFNPNDEWSFTGGFQNAAEISGQTLSARGWGQHRYTSFGQVLYSPTINGQSGQYSLLVYNQPSVTEQPENTTGWSISASQNLSDTWGVFVRANANSGNTSVPIKQSYVVGGVMNNPFNRNPNDQIGLAFAANKVAKQYFDSSAKMRNFESVVEGFWTIGITQFFSITPDVQLYIHPALKTKSDFGTVFSLRGTIQL